MTIIDEPRAHRRHGAHEDFGSEHGREHDPNPAAGDPARRFPIPTAETGAAARRRFSPAGGGAPIAAGCGSWPLTARHKR